MDKIKRWYDKILPIKEVLHVLNIMTERELNQVSNIFFQVVNDFKKNKHRQNSLRTLGAERLVNYYKSYQKRRWYDKNQFLHNAVMMLSIMSPREIIQIIDIFIRSLKMEGLDVIYATRKKELQ